MFSAAYCRRILGASDSQYEEILFMRRSFSSPSAGSRREGPSAHRCERSPAPRRGAPRWFILGGLLLLAAGCARGGPAHTWISPREAADRALAEYDTNNDGALDAKELEACPGLRSALKRIDKNNDGRLTADEIADRLAFFEREGAMVGVGVEVTFDGNPLSGATVTLVPEKFLGPYFKPCAAVTDRIGTGALEDENSGDLIPLGFYRVEVSKKNSKGQETIPTRYNTKTVLGQEIAPDVEGKGSILTVRLRLTSK
jgi:hypothetical protein